MKRTAFYLFVTALLITCFARLLCAQVPVKKFITRDGKRPSGLFAPGVIVGKTLYISGKGDQIPGGGHPEAFPEQVRQCLENVRSTLELAGLGMEHVVKSWVYLDDIDNFEAMNKVYVSFFPKDAPPARTTVAVGRVPGGSHIEITCIAYTDLSEKKKVGGEASFDLPFSPGIIAGTTLYISGQGDHLPGGGHPETFEKQARQCMFWVGEVLKEAGLDWRHVVWTSVYLDKVGYDNLGIMDKVYSEFFEFGNEPARSTVFINDLPVESHIEITCIATTDLTSRKVVRPASMKYGPKEMAMSASPAVWAGNTLYMSLLSGFDPVEGITTVDLEIQVRQMAQNNIDILDAAGLGLEDIVSGNVYLRNLDDYAPFNTIYKEYFSKGPGVRTCLMPNSGYEKNDVRMNASFIAARTRPE